MCVLPMARNYRSVVLKHQALIDFAPHSLLRPCIDVARIAHALVSEESNARAHRCGRSTRGIACAACDTSRAAHALHHWQASQVGSSMAQNLMSVAGASAIAACACCAAASSAERPPMPPEVGTALSCLRSTVL